MAYIGITSATDSEQLSPNYIGFQPTFQRPESAFVVDTFTADGSQQVFPLSAPRPTTSRALLVSVAGYSMVPIIDYDLDQYGNLEFVTAPGSGASITVHHLIFPKNEATTAIRKLDDISSGFNGVNTRFTLTANSVAANILGANVLVISVNGVIQEPGEAYIMDDDDIIFSEAPPVHSSFYGIDVGTTGIGTPGDATITSNKFITDNTASTGKVLGVNSSGELSWVTVTGGIGATDLDGLSDVSLALPMSGQVLRFNGSNFVNARLNYSDLQGPPSLAAVATSGSYNDLTNKPVYPTDINGFTDSLGLLFDGDYASLINLPNIPDQLTDLMDIDVANLTYNQVLVYDGNAWINDSLQLTDLGIVDGSAGQVLTTNGSGEFTFTTITGGSGGSPYTLPTATTSALGGVKVDGTSITISNGIISASGVTSYNDLTDKPTIPTSFSSLVNGAYTVSLSNTGITTFPGVINAGNINNLVVNDLGGGTALTAGSQLQIGNSAGIAGAGVLIKNAVTNTLSGVTSLESGSKIQMDNGIVSLSSYTVNVLGDGDGLENQLVVEVDNNYLNNVVRIGTRSITTTEGTPLSAFQGWTFGTVGPSQVITFPNSTVQSTAWTGSVAYSSVTGTPTLATVATSGSYADLSDKPTIPADVSELTDTTSLLFSGSYTDLTDKPTLLKGDTGDTGPAGPAGADGATGPQGPSGEGLINQTIILNNIAPSIIYTNTAVTEWSASYTGTGGQLLVKADITSYTSSSATKNWYLKKNGTTVATGSFFFNNANVHLTMPTLQYVDTTGSTAAATWSITVGSGLVADMGDCATITVTEYTGITSIDVSDLTDTTSLLFSGSYTDLTDKPNIAEKTTGSWTLAAGANTVSLTVPINGTYSIWVRGNIPNGIVTYTATAVVTNTNVPVVGSSYGWYYAAGNALVLTAIPMQFVGTANTISNAVVSTTTANVFTFGITNNTGSSQVVDWGYTKL